MKIDERYLKQKVSFSAIRAYANDHERIKAITKANPRMTIASAITMLIDNYYKSEVK